jgi:hypothetical protein
MAAGTFLRAYDANRRAVLEDVIEADPTHASANSWLSEPPGPGTRKTFCGSASMPQVECHD